MKKQIVITIIALFSFSATSQGDIAFPTVTKVYFEKNSQPHHQSVDFTIACYGYNFKPGQQSIPRKPVGTYTPETVFSMSGKCPDYGCEIHDSFYVSNYCYIDYCNLTGKTDGKEFKIDKYATRPLDDSKCTNAKNKMERACELKFSIPNP